MLVQADIVEEVADALEEYTGQRGGATVVLRDLSVSSVPWLMILIQFHVACLSLETTLVRWEPGCWMSVNSH